MHVSSLINESPLYNSKLKRYMRLMLNMNSPIYRYISNVQYDMINLRHCIWGDINQIRMIRNHKKFLKINYSIKLIYFSKIIKLIFFMNFCNKKIWNFPTGRYSSAQDLFSGE